MYRHFVLGTVLLFAGLSMFAQTQTPTQAPTQTQTQDQQPPSDSSQSGDRSGAPAAAVGGALLVPGTDESEGESYWMKRPVVPAIVGGYGSSLAFGSEMERSNYIRGGVTLQTTYDDNPFLTNPSVTNYTYSIFPQISLDQSRSRVRWLLNYAGGYTYNQKLSNQNQTSQNFNFDVEYRVSPHVNVRATETISLTTGLFGPVNNFNGTVPGVPLGTNPYVLTPLAKEFSTTTRGDISYQFSATDVVGASGGLNTLKYRDAAPGTLLLDTQGEDAAGYYMHRITESNWLGGSYVFQHLGYSPGLNNTVVHSMLGFDTWQVKPTMTISLFAGPQYADDRLQVTPPSSPAISSTQWSFSGGASYSWQGQHTSVSLSYARRIADGGGVLGSVQLNSVSGSLRQRLSPRWSMLLNVDYGGNDALSPAVAQTQSFTYVSGGASVTRQFGQSCFLQVGYTRQNQNTKGLSSLSTDAHRNYVIASFSYQFARPWGR